LIKENQIDIRPFWKDWDEDWGAWEDKVYRSFLIFLLAPTLSGQVKKYALATFSDKWSIPSTRFAFMVMPTWWAYLLYFLAFGLIVYGVGQTIRQAEFLAKEREKNSYWNLASSKE